MSALVARSGRRILVHRLGVRLGLLAIHAGLFEMLRVGERIECHVSHSGSGCQAVAGVKRSKSAEVPQVRTAEQ
jgi:hypothetical protein